MSDWKPFEGLTLSFENSDWRRHNALINKLLDSSISKDLERLKRLRENKYINCNFPSNFKANKNNRSNFV
jgi:hypothetical protein